MAMTFEQAYFTYHAYYCDQAQEIEDIISWLDSAEDGSYLPVGPEERERFGESGVILSYLVLMFGSHGSSHDYGGIEDTEAASEWLKKQRMMYAVFDWSTMFESSEFDAQD